MIIEITNKYIQLIIFIHSKIFKRFGFNIYQKTHVAGGLPLPIKNGTRIRVHFFENLYPYENIMSIKKKFIDGQKSYQLSSTAKSAQILTIWADLAVLLSWYLFCPSMKFFFVAHYIFIWVKSFKKVLHNFCSISSG